MADELSQRLWNADVTPAAYAGDADKRYRSAILAQYQMYVEMADRISERRAGTNTFFLTVNTGIVTVFGALRSTSSTASPAWLVLVLAALLAQCAAWFYIVRSYRQLNHAKYQIIGELEARLPASPYWRAEWVALGEGKDRSKYWPLSHLEQWVPVTFAAIYVAGFLSAVAT